MSGKTGVPVSATLLSFGVPSAAAAMQNRPSPSSRPVPTSTVLPSATAEVAPDAVMPSSRVSPLAREMAWTDVQGSPYTSQPPTSWKYPQLSAPGSGVRLMVPVARSTELT
ncbi:hypothetical protein [Streptomyces sp. NPDC001809]